MKSRQLDVMAFIVEEEESLSMNFGVENICVFGSFARGAADGEAVEFMVEFYEGQRTKQNFNGLKRHLENELEKKVKLKPWSG